MRPGILPLESHLCLFCSWSSETITFRREGFSPSLSPLAFSSSYTWGDLDSTSETSPVCNQLLRSEAAVGGLAMNMGMNYHSECGKWGWT